MGAWLWDWSGSVCVLLSLYFLWSKNPAYWHWGNLSLLPYFMLFVTTSQYLLAGLQATYLLFGLHGLALWRLEDRGSARAGLFRVITTPLALLIFLYAAHATDFSDGWAYLQLAIVSASLVANWGTTRRRAWSWLAWLPVNAAQAVYFFHFGLWGLFGLQFLLFAMSVHGYARWREDNEVGSDGLGGRQVPSAP